MACNAAILLKNTAFGPVGVELSGSNPKSFEFNFKFAGQLVSTLDSKQEDYFNNALHEFEQKHPDVFIEDFLDFKKQLPGDTPFADIVNQVKRNLVTIEQTSALRRVNRYRSRRGG